MLSEGPTLDCGYKSDLAPRDDIVVRDLILGKLRRSFRNNPPPHPQSEDHKIVRELLDLFSEWRELRVPRRNSPSGLREYMVYSIARLCHWLNIEESRLVAESLTAIYECYKHFSGIFLHAFRDTEALRPSWRWRKYKTTDRATETICVVVFFLEHANRQKLLFQNIRLIDLNLWGSRCVPPGILAALCGRPALLLALLQHGALLKNSITECKYYVLVLLRKLYRTPYTDTDGTLKEAGSVWPSLSANKDTISDPNLLDICSCLTLILRAIPSVPGRSCLHCDLLPSDNGGSESSPYGARAHSLRFISWLSREGLVPALEIRYLSPAELAHLCRCSIRKSLHELWKLPHGIRQLPVPESVKNYIHLLKD